MTTDFLTIEQVATAAISNSLYDAKEGTVLVPYQLITYNYSRYPFAEHDLLNAIHQLIETIHVNRKMIVKQDGEYTVVKSDRPSEGRGRLYSRS